MPSRGFIHLLKEKYGFIKRKGSFSIPSSTQMAVECTFGIFRERWRILLKRINMPLQTISNIVTSCLCLHNHCIIYGDKFDLDWAKNAKEDTKNGASKSFDDLINANMFHILDISKLTSYFFTMFFIWEVSYVTITLII